MDNNLYNLYIFTGWLRQWRCSSQRKSRYLFLDNGQVAENLKESKDSVLVELFSLGKSQSIKY